MFDIGFAELVIIAVVGLLVIGPERLPGAIRTGSAWLGRIKRGFNDVKREVEQELHNDAVMQELRETSEQIKSQGEQLGREVQAAQEQVKSSVESTVKPTQENSDSSSAAKPND
jgi:sec-independent protein translocase protein TatB